MIEIGYDLDGVLISDMQVFEPIETYLLMREKIPKPVFIPSNEYVIITGRLYSDISHTLSWIDSELSSNPPKKIYHDNIDLSTPEQYKAKVINNIGLKYFIESDEAQVEFLKENTNANIVHFKDLLQFSLNNVLDLYVNIKTIK